MAMMRRWLSILLFVAGGFCVGMEVMIAFMGGDGAASHAGRVLYFAAIAAVVLALATWLSPGRRRRELGLAMLIGAGVCVGSFASVIFLPDEQGKFLDREELRPFLALVPGFANLALVVGMGLLLRFADRGGAGRLSSGKSSLSIFS